MEKPGTPPRSTFFTQMRSNLGEMEFADFYGPFVESHRALLELRKKDLREYPNRKKV